MSLPFGEMENLPFKLALMCVLLSWPVYTNVRSQKLVKIKVMKLSMGHEEAAPLNDKQAQLQEDLWSDIHY